MNAVRHSVKLLSLKLKLEAPLAIIIRAACPVRFDFNPISSMGKYILIDSKADSYKLATFPCSI